jgi:hypothetical protein
MTEEGTCRECLPYNLYANDNVQDLFSFDDIKRFVRDNLETFRKVDFEEAERSYEDSDQTMKTIDVVFHNNGKEMPLSIIPTIDEDGCESLWFVKNIPALPDIDSLLKEEDPNELARRFLEQMAAAKERIRGGAAWHYFVPRK